jgi:hypothetical protein
VPAQLRPVAACDATPKIPLQAEPPAAAVPAQLRPVAACDATPKIPLQAEPPPQDARRDRVPNLAGRIAASARDQVAMARKRATQLSSPWPPARAPVARQRAQQYGL